MRNRLGLLVIIGINVMITSAIIVYSKWNKHQHHHSFDYYWRNDSFNPVTPIQS